ncbi:MAG: prolipoprotein diacylglyceryl transferase [Kiloniellales bacterium]
MTPLFVLPFPAIDPVALDLGPLQIRWYALAYIVGIVLAWLYCRALARRPESPATVQAVDDLVFWATLGILIGGRLGLVLFYQPSYFLAHPLDIVKVWEGGMSFHGGFLGVIAALFYVAWRHKLHFFTLADLAAAGAPIGIFLGRIANFVNGELWGRASDASWAMIFPDPAAGGIPRHPSQLYQAFAEGLVVFIVLRILVQRGWLGRPGRVAAAFALTYGLARFIDEFWREPDSYLGFHLGFVTQGQILSVPMILIGLYFLWRLRGPLPPAPAATPAQNKSPDRKT